MAAHTIYTVEGMTCEHCVGSVTEEISQLPGVRGVQVELATGQVTVTSAEVLRTEEVRAAVIEAGYRLVNA